MTRLTREAILTARSPKRCQRNIPDKARCPNRGDLLLVEGFKEKPRWYCQPCVDELMRFLGNPDWNTVEDLVTGEIVHKVTHD